MITSVAYWVFRRLVEQRGARHADSIPDSRPRLDIHERLRRVFFQSEDIQITRSPARAPKANAIAERLIGTLRCECLDWLLIVNRRHLEHVLLAYVDHYNGHRPHRSLGQRPPMLPSAIPRARGNPANVHRRDRLGGLIHEYEIAA